ncbi:MAG: radical SAM family heme chaperone HemW [Bacteroidota bacterium]
MSGIYLHIPFCKQACSYCNFHFATSLKKKNALLSALKKELRLRKEAFANETVSTIYFGGGTPSLLTFDELQKLLDEVYKNYRVATAPEITLEANPDDLNAEKIKQLARSSFNRLSIGIQSFFDTDLKLMHRSHTANTARACLEEATTYFKNLSIDLIYGIPGMTHARWQQNIATALLYKVPHVSAYALTVEPRTALAVSIKKGTVPPLDDALAQQHFFTLTAHLAANDFVHYEVSNFGRKRFFSRHNTSYWQGKPYLGIGPSAHSFNGRQRSWNIANNSKYIAALTADTLALTVETLSKTDRYNEYIMTGLRTIWGVSLTKIARDFGTYYKTYVLSQAEKYMTEGLLFLDSPTGQSEADVLKTTKKGKFFSDGIASDLFLLNLR